jgi:sulfate/thiosulfate transport system permease protein
VSSFSPSSRNVIPGFRGTLAFAVGYLAVFVVLPLGFCLVKAGSLTLDEFLAAAWNPRARAAYALTFGASFAAACINLVFGTLVAWVLVRYDFPFKRIVDSLIDLPFALPTAVAGLVYSSLYVESGWLGRWLVPMGIHAVYTPLGVVLVLTFIGLPFVVRAVQPVLESIDLELEEAAAALGADRWESVVRVVLPTLLPAMTTGFALAFARSLGEYGSVVFVSGNLPFRTEIAPVLIYGKLEEFRYADATALATVLLAASFFMLAAINRLERWSQQRYG